MVLVGLDAADVDFVAAHLPALPHLRGLAEDPAGPGLRRLTSPAPGLSASAWPSFYTGAPPAEHGFYYPMQWDARSLRLRRVSDAWLHCEPFWYELARNGIPVTALDVQTQLPSTIALGTEITNWGAQSFNVAGSNEPGILRELERRFGRHPLGPEVPARKTRRRLARVREDCLAGVRARGEAVRWLMAETEWRLFLTSFSECHRAGHNLWPCPATARSDPDGTALLDVYRAIDAEIGKLLEALDLGTTTLFVFALHGMGPNHTQMHHVPAVMDRINATFPGGRGAPRPRRSLRRRLRETLPGPLQELVGRHVPDGVRDFVVSGEFAAGIDWARTPGFALPSGAEVLVRCNLAGRERKGWLEPDGALHRSYLDHVRRGFESLRGTDGDEPLVAKVTFPSTEPGARAHLLPDVAMTWREIEPCADLQSAVLGRFRGESRTGRSGNHRPGGFVVVAGARPCEGASLELTDITDFAKVVPRLF